MVECANVFCGRSYKFIALCNGFHEAFLRFNNHRGNGCGIHTVFFLVVFLVVLFAFVGCGFFRFSFGCGFFRFSFDFGIIITGFGFFQSPNNRLVIGAAPLDRERIYAAATEIRSLSAPSRATISSPRSPRRRSTATA